MTARLHGHGQGMIAPQNMAYAHVCLSRLSPRRLPPNTLEQLQKKNTTSNAKECTSSGCITHPNTGCDAMDRSCRNHTLTVHQRISDSRSAKFSRDMATHYVGQWCCGNTSLPANSMGKEAVESEAEEEESETLSFKLHDAESKVDMNANSCKYKRALFSAKSLCCPNDDAGSVVSTSFSTRTFDSSNFIADDRSSEVSDSIYVNYSPGLSSSYSPPESPDSSLIARSPSEEREILQLPGNVELVETGIAKDKRNYVVPREVKVLHVECDTQSRNSQLSPNIPLSKLMHSKTVDVRHLSAGIPGLQIPEIKLLPLKIKDNVNDYRDSGAHVRKGCGSRMINRRVTCSLEKKLVVQLFDIGDQVKLSSKGGYELIGQGKQCTNHGRRIPNCEDVSVKTNVKGLPKRDVKRHKKGGKTSTKDSLLAYKKNNIRKQEALKKSEKRKREPKEKRVRKYRIPKKYENTKFSEIQTISRIKTRYRVAFAKWPQVFTQALDLINQRIASQNALSFYLRREETGSTA